MPELGDFPKYLHTVDDFLLQRSNQAGSQGCFSRCNCGSGFKSELFNCCSECQFQDVKPGEFEKAPPLLEPSFWPRASPSILLAEPIVTEDNTITGPPSCTRVNRSRTSPTNVCSLRSQRSPYRTQSSQRGRPPNGSRPPPGFKGVRQRKGVRGYLVEIRPPKWKRTIWLGTYNTDREAAGAYDAGIFYTNKKTKYNFPHLQGTFPPLPEQLRLDNVDDAEKIKTFVQHEARLAAQKVRSLPPSAESSQSSTLTSQAGPAAGASSASSDGSSDLRETSTGVAPMTHYSDESWDLLFEYFDASFPQSGNMSQLCSLL